MCLVTGQGLLDTDELFADVVDDTERVHTPAIADIHDASCCPAIISSLFTRLRRPNFISLSGVRRMLWFRVTSCSYCGRSSHVREFPFTGRSCRFPLRYQSVCLVARNMGLRCQPAQTSARITTLLQRVNLRSGSRPFDLTGCFARGPSVKAIPESRRDFLVLLNPRYYVDSRSSDKSSPLHILQVPAPHPFSLALHHRSTNYYAV
jgi:hypothetical protein